jgi:hypothetical protein
MTGFFDVEDFLDPRDNFVGAGIGGFVEVDNSILEVLLEGSLEGRVAGGNWGVVRGEHIHLMVVFEQQRPLLRPDPRALLRRPYHVLLVDDLFLDWSLLLCQSFLFFVATHC